jgi:hypothetical protein
MKLLILLTLTCFQAVAQNMFPILLSTKYSNKVEVKVLEIISVQKDDNDFYGDISEYIENDKVKVTHIDSSHYYIKLPPNGFFFVTAYEPSTDKLKSLFVRTGNVYHNLLNLSTDFKNTTATAVWYDKNLNKYRTEIVKRVGDD